MPIEQNLYGPAMFSKHLSLILFSMHFVTNAQSNTSSKHNKKNAHSVDTKSKVVEKLLVGKYSLLCKINKYLFVYMNEGVRTSEEGCASCCW